MLRQLSKSIAKNVSLAREGNRSFCSSYPAVEKSLNQVTLLGRVGVDPQMKGSDKHPVVTFSLATNTNIRMDGESLRQKTEWHRISVFKPFLRDSVHSFVKKGSRILVTGKIMYGEILDHNGNQHQTTTIVADDVIFIGRRESLDEQDMNEASL